MRVSAASLSGNEVRHMNRSVVFIGSTPNIGTTVAAFGTAMSIASETDQTVGYLCLNLKSSKLHRYLGVEEPSVTLDALRAELKSRTLTPSRLRQQMYTVREASNLSVLFGSIPREQAEFYEPEHFEHLLYAAESAFDLCVIDVSAYWDNAATICALLHADTRFIITTQDITHFQEDVEQWLGSMAPVFGLGREGFNLIVTQQESNSGFSMKEIQKETGINVVGELNRFEELTRVINQGKLAEWLRDYTEGTDWSEIAHSLMARFELQRRIMVPAKPWYRRLGWERQEVRT